MMRRGDKILIVIIIAAIAAGYGYKYYNDYKNRDKKGIAVIELDGKQYGKYDLEKEGSKVFDMKLPSGERSIVEIKDGSIRIKDAGCPDRVCVRTGWISKPGDVIVCLPYRIVIKITGEKQDVDVNAF
jgi:hypothetical protein